jgi:SAM-dependent methyltransferase
MVLELANWIKIWPDGKAIPEEEMLKIFNSFGATRESLFRRYEMNEVIQYTKGLGVDIGCGLNKIHSAAIGVDWRLSENDAGYPFGAQVRASGDRLEWLTDSSLDYVFSSHCLEHFPDTESVLREWARVIRKGGYLVLLLPHRDYYPVVGTPGANPDHKHDFTPADISALIRKMASLSILSIDTIRRKLEDHRLAKAEAGKYGHLSLNFSFEVVAQKR